jgi:hypothetical protein
VFICDTGYQIPLLALHAIEHAGGGRRPGARGAARRAGGGGRAASRPPAVAGAVMVMDGRTDMADAASRSSADPRRRDRS